MLPDAAVDRIDDANHHARVPRISRLTGLASIILLTGSVLLLEMPGHDLWQRLVQDAGHGPVFAGVAAILLLMAPGDARSGARRGSHYARAFAIAVLLGVVTELIQRYQPGRSVSALDVLHDAAGATLGLALVHLLDRRAVAPATAITMNLPALCAT
ncbi:MAG: VanZ family protein, partial [Steroidobacteraceae bacterium]